MAAKAKPPRKKADSKAKRVCKSCRHWCQYVREPFFGRCTRYPPTNRPAPDASPWQRWLVSQSPVTGRLDRCGEWAKR